MLIVAIWLLSSCTNLYEDLPECRLFVKFKYDYNMLYADAFHTQVDKVELYVFDKDGKYLFKQSEEGAALVTGSYLMEVELPVGEYQFMAWTGAHDSYDITSMTPGSSTITDMKLQLIREESFIIKHELEPLWYGEIIKVNFTGTTHQTETINLIKDTNKVRFVFQGYREDSWQVNVNDYDYEIIESNGHLAHDNSLLDDDVLSFQPYITEQVSPYSAAVELNTMRLMANRQTRFVVTEKATGKKVFNINLIDYLAMTKLGGNKMETQEYLDRESEFKIIFFFSEAESWLAVQVQIGDWIWRIQTEEEI
ncbi:FimB/Mfa2 family fimbrial subunit [Bacteroides sp.]|uniref:FimB/Mfa2 family fimbrial subunit n=1 Tax=Bacteroides sp. TaxID=29523 RepID=UPI002585E583|nr:FimB/Mfa2 family fimbrial subunit [Bacteroides sp.]